MARGHVAQLSLVLYHDRREEKMPSRACFHFFAINLNTKNKLPSAFKKYSRDGYVLFD